MLIGEQNVFLWISDAIFNSILYELYLCYNIKYYFDDWKTILPELMNCNIAIWAVASCMATRSGRNRR